MLKPRQMWDIPQETAELARQVFAKGNDWMRLRDELAVWYRDEPFAELFVWRGQPAESPGLLAMVTVMQYAEGLTDREAALAVGSRIDWKYVLGLELNHPPLHHSVLGDFRERVIAGGQEGVLLDGLLVKLQAKGWLKGGGKQRTDSTHLVSAARQLNRLECVLETMRVVLNDLAVIAPDWLGGQVSRDWFELYGPRVESYRLPQRKAEQAALQQRIGGDGYHLLTAIYEADSLPWLRQMPSVQLLRLIWIQQFYLQEEEVHWRTAKELPPNKLLIQSPHDPQARNRTKRDLNWTGYSSHLTESCDPETPNFITHVATTPATTNDVEVTELIHQELADKGLLPAQQYADTSYVSAENLVSSQQRGVELCGPVISDPSWQAQAKQGYDLSSFTIDWQAQTVTCPQGHLSQRWRTRRDDDDREVIEVRFALAHCQACPVRSLCTKSRSHARLLRLRPQAQHLALQQARQRQQTPQFQRAYQLRAGIEGTISQATGAFALRYCRYIGLAKTHFQNLAVAAAINLSRLAAHLAGRTKAQTHPSRFAALALCLT